MLCIYDHHGALWLQLFHKQVGKLGSKPLLDLRPLCEHLKGLCQLPNACNLPGARDIGNMRFTDKRQKVVLADGIKGDVLQEDKLFMALALYMLEKLIRRSLKA